MNFFDAIFPNFSCLACKNEINASANPYICDACEKALQKRKQTFGALAPFYYKSPVSDLILRFKYNSEGDIAKLFSPFMAQIIKKANIQADIIIPVPLSAERIKQRGYNQALTLANEVSKLSCLPVKDALMRVKKTEAQKNMTLKERQANLKNAFKIKNGGSKQVKGKRILLVDDVYTTGTTALECSKVLAKAGAADVKVLTIAKVEQ